MKMKISATAVLLLAAAAHAQPISASYQQIAGVASANDMSSDGRWIVGEIDVNGDFIPDGTYLFENVDGGIVTQLPQPAIGAVAVSDDGTVVLGELPGPMDYQLGATAAMWTQSSGVWTSLGHLPNALECPSLSSAYELSADGTTAVGLSWDGCNALGIVWTQASGMLPLQELANGSNRASVISADGSVIGGFAQGVQNRTPAAWDDSLAGFLLDPPNGFAVGEVHGVRDDGSMLLVEWNPGTASDSVASSWTTGAGIQTIAQGHLLPGWSGIPLDISDDGTIVGFDILLGNRRAWIQPQGTGDLLEFKAYIQSLGAELPPIIGLKLEVPQAISTDSRYVVGHGYGTGAWLVTFGFCDGDADGNGVVDVNDITFIIPLLGQPGPAGDVDGNGVVDVNDITFVIPLLGTDCVALPSAPAATASEVPTMGDLPAALRGLDFELLRHNELFDKAGALLPAAWR